MNLETKIAEKVHSLPPVKQAEVLAFVEKLENAKEINGQVFPTAEKSEAEKKAGRHTLIGIFRSGKRNISERAEEILFEEIDKRSGWTVKK